MAILGGLHTNIYVRHPAADAFFKRDYTIIIAKARVCQSFYMKKSLSLDAY